MLRREAKSGEGSRSSSAWYEHLPWAQGAAGSNPVSSTEVSGRLAQKQPWLKFD